jgi:hypothetical protein
LPRTRVFYDRGDTAARPMARQVNVGAVAFAGVRAMFEAGGGEAAEVLAFDDEEREVPDVAVCGGQVEASFWGAGACFLEESEDGYCSDEDGAVGDDAVEQASAAIRLAPRPRLPMPLIAQRELLSAARAESAAAACASSVVRCEREKAPRRSMAPARRAISALRPAAVAVPAPVRQPHSFAGAGGGALVLRAAAPVPAGADAVLHAATVHRAEFNGLAKAAADSHRQSRASGRHGLLAKIGRRMGRLH